MSRLTSKERKALPASQFAGPNRSYPVQDRGHAIAAKARAAEFASPSVRKEVDAKANKVLHAVGGSPPAPGQTVTNGTWAPPTPATPSSPGQGAVNDMRAKMQGKVTAAGGCSGLDTAMMAHADKVHPVGRR